MNPLDLVPKNKFDTKTVELLYSLENAAFLSISYELLEWIQDINWPVAQALVPLLISRQDVVIDAIQKALDTNDDGWKYWILIYLIPELSDLNYAILFPKLSAIHTQPSHSEIQEEVYLEIGLLFKKKHP